MHYLLFYDVVEGYAERRVPLRAEHLKHARQAVARGELVLGGARHRAVLFGLLGLVLILAAFRPVLQPLAFVAGFASVLSFLYLAWSVGGYNSQVGRVFAADVAALVCLVIGAAALVLLGKSA